MSSLDQNSEEMGKRKKTRATEEQVPEHDEQKKHVENASSSSVEKSLYEVDEILLIFYKNIIDFGCLIFSFYPRLPSFCVRARVLGNSFDYLLMIYFVFLVIYENLI